MFTSSVIYTNIDCYLFYMYIINTFEQGIQGEIYIHAKDDASAVKLICTPVTMHVEAMGHR